MNERIPLSRPSTGAEELQAVEEVLQSGWLAGQGPHGVRLEERFVGLTDRQHAIAVNNCTAGLHLVLAALEIGTGDEVIVADYSYPATAHAVLYCGATPRFADVKRETGTLDPAVVAPLLTPRTRAIVGVDALGMPADWEQLTDIATSHNLALVADAACSLGARLGSRPAGAFGDAAVFSLHARKGVTCGEGGVVVTDDPDLAARVRSASSFGQTSAFERAQSGTFDVPQFVRLGYNYKLADVLAAIANVQVDRVQELTDARRRLADRYRALLHGTKGVEVPQEPSDRRSSWQTYAVTLDEEIDRGRVIEAMREGGVECGIGTFSLSRQDLYRSTDVCENSWLLADRQLALPLYPSLTEHAQDRVVQVLEKVLDVSLRSSS